MELPRQRLPPGATCTLTRLENNGSLNLNGYTITLADGTVLR